MYAAPQPTGRTESVSNRPCLCCGCVARRLDGCAVWRASARPEQAGRAWGRNGRERYGMVDGNRHSVPFGATGCPVGGGRLTRKGRPEPACVPRRALALGAVPAGNPTRAGASADRNRRPPCRRSLRRQISFRHLTLYGLIVTALTIAVSAAYVRLHSLLLV